MNAIKENPYRTLGLFGNTTEKELQKQIAIIKRFSEVGKSKTFDYDFLFLGDINREHETVVKAASHIEQAKNKVLYSLFWFLNTNSIDEIALSHLKDTNIDKAIEIWEKLIKENSINKKNYSAALNLSTLQMGMTILNGSFDPIQFKRCIELKGQIISSDFFLNFVQAVAGDNINISKELIRKEFVDEILQILKPYLNNLNGITSSQLIDAFSCYPTDSRHYVEGKLTDRPVNNIENQIEITKNNREKNSKDANKLGVELYESTKQDILFLKTVWSESNVKYQIIANKLANEILQCSIDYYNSIVKNDTDTEIIEIALKIAKIAKSVGSSGNIKERIDESIRTLGKIKFRDCYKVIDTLTVIKDAFIKLDNENAYKSAYEKKIINQTKVSELINREISDKIIKKISTSNNQELTEMYYELIVYLSKRINNSTLFNRLENVFYNSLSESASVKRKIEESRQRREKNEKERFEKEKIEKQRRKRTESEWKKKERKRNAKFALWGIAIAATATLIVYSIWDVDGLYVMGVIAFLVFLGYLKNT